MPILREYLLLKSGEYEVKRSNLTEQTEQTISSPNRIEYQGTVERLVVV